CDSWLRENARADRRKTGSRSRTRPPAQPSRRHSSRGASVTDREPLYRSRDPRRSGSPEPLRGSGAAEFGNGGIFALPARGQRRRRNSSLSAAEPGGPMTVTSRQTRNIHEIMRDRHSTRVAFDPRRPVPEPELCAILEAARWAPTAHNMQNFEILVVDDASALAAIGRVRTTTSQEFIRENYAQLAFSPDELRRKGTGLLATMFPPAWRSPTALSGDTRESEHGFLDQTMSPCPVVLVVVRDTRKRAPASENDFLGALSLGCVMENMWLAAEALGIEFQIMSVFSGAGTEKELGGILHLPEHMKIAFACRLGYPANPVPPYLRVRRETATFVHHNIFGNLRTV